MGSRVEEQIGCDNFYGTQGCGVNLGEEINDGLKENGIHNCGGDSDSNRSEYVSFDDLGSFASNDKDYNEDKDEFVRRKSKRSKYDGKTQQPFFSLGKEFLDAIAKYSVAIGLKFRYTRKKPNKIRVVCQENRPFVI
ncbi:hypothetical protein GH714_007654 [Hevea brasiliensis]|uniref:Transposase MuDR plant domain-containing protein n=1 Tax=Hevea brasiliensis TaxID=3981 RepID=A0A6A6KHS0_HEVBR|nr:hypothetical protein GH714_007654 [Hevea brasiliensis]